MTQKTRRSLLRAAGVTGSLLAGGGTVITTAAAGRTSGEESGCDPVQWRERFETDRGDPMPFQTPPVATDDALFVAGAAPPCPPVNEIVSLGRSTGQRRWSYRIGDPVVQGFAVASGTVIAGTSNRLVALDAGDGTRRWQRDAGALASAFVREDETVYAPIELPDGGAALVALDAKSGRERWRYDGVDGDLSAIEGLAADGDQVYLGASFDGERAGVAVDAASGARNWRLDDGFESISAATDGFVFTADRSSPPEHWLVARDATDGSVSWEAPIDRGISPHAISTGDDTAYVPNGGFPGQHRGLTAVDLADGSIRWWNPIGGFSRDYDSPTNDPFAYHSAPPRPAGDVVYVSYERFVVAVDATGDEIRGQYEANDVLAGITLGDGTNYVTDRSGDLTALEPLA